MLSIRNTVNQHVAATTSSSNLVSETTQSVIPKITDHTITQHREHKSRGQFRQQLPSSNKRPSSLPTRFSKGTNRNYPVLSMPTYYAHTACTSTIQTPIESIELPADAKLFDKYLQEKKYNVETYLELKLKPYDLEYTQQKTQIDTTKLIDTIKILESQKKLFIDRYARLDNEGLITEFDIASTDDATAIAIHTDCMMFLNSMDFFQDFCHLKNIGILAPESYLVLQKIPKELIPALITSLSLKREVGIVLTVAPELYKELKEIEIGRKYLAEQAPFDNIKQQQDFLKSFNLDQLSQNFSFSDKQIRLNQAYQAGFNKLQTAEETYKNTLFSRNGKQRGLIDQAYTLEKLPKNEIAREQAIIKRELLIQQLKAQTQSYLQTLYEVVKDIEQNGGGCVVPSFYTSIEVKRAKDKYLAKLDEKIMSYLWGDRNVLGRKKTKFFELCAFFESSRLLPETYGASDRGPLALILTELEAIYQKTNQTAKTWAQDTITSAFLAAIPVEVMDKKESNLQVETTQKLAKNMTTKWQTTGELPLFLGEGAQEIEQAVDTLCAAGLLFIASETATSIDCEQALQISLDALKTIGILTPAAYCEIIAAPEYMRSYMLKSLGLKQTIAEQLLNHPHMIDQLKQLDQSYQYLAQQAVFTGTEEKLKQANQIYPLAPHLDPLFILQEAKYNLAYREGAKRFESAQKIYQQALFSSMGKKQPSLWNYALQLKKKPEDVFKIPERYQFYIDERNKILERIFSAINSYFDATLSALQEIEAQGGKIRSYSAKCYQQKTQDYLHHLMGKTEDYLEGKRAWGNKSVPFSKLLKTIEENEFLPDANGSVGTSILAEINRTLNKTIEIAKQKADRWLLAAGIEILKETYVSSEHNNTSEKEQVQIIKTVAQKITDQIETLKREEIDKIKKMIPKEGGFFSALLNAMDTIKEMNDQYDWEVAMRYPRYESYKGSGRTRHIGYDDSYYYEYPSIDFSSKKQPSQSTYPSTSTALMVSNTSGMNTITSDRNQLCQELGLSARATNTEIKNAYRREIIQCHPDKAEIRELCSELRLQGEERFKRIHTLYKKL